MKIDRTIKSPEGVSLLMENMWLRYKAGMQQRACNVFMVELPSPTPDEIAINIEKKAQADIDTISLDYGEEDENFE